MGKRSKKYTEAVSKIEKGKVALLLGESELTTVSIDEVQIYEA